MIGAVLAVLVVEVLGAAVLTLLSSDLARWTTAGRLGLSFGLGWVVLGVTLFLASLCGIPVAWWIGVGLTLALWGAVAILVPARLAGWRPGRVEAPRPIEAILMGLIVAIVLAVGAVSLLEPVVEWDVVSFWALKAQILGHETARTTGYFQDLSKAYSHLDYPLLWPLAMAWVWAFVGRVDWVAVKVLAPALLAALAALAYGLLRRRVERPSALLFVALLVGVPMLLSQTSRLLADPLLAYWVAGTFLCAYLGLDGGHSDDLRIAGFFAAGMLFTKNEGIGLFVVLVALTGIAIVATGKRSRAGAFLGWLVVAPLVLTGAWFAFRLGIPKVGEDYGHRLGVGSFFQNAGRVPEVVLGSLRYFGDWSDWLAFWPIVALAVGLGARRWLGRPPMFLVAAVLSILGMYGATYVVSPWELADLMEFTSNRLLLHVTPLCVFLLAEIFRPELVGAGSTGS